MTATHIFHCGDRGVRNPADGEWPGPKPLWAQPRSVRVTFRGFAALPRRPPAVVANVAKERARLAEICDHLLKAERLLPEIDAAQGVELVRPVCQNALVTVLLVQTNLAWAPAELFPVAVEWIKRLRPHVETLTGDCLAALPENADALEAAQLLRFEVEAALETSTQAHAALSGTQEPTDA